MAQAATYSKIKEARKRPLSSRETKALEARAKAPPRKSKKSAEPWHGTTSGYTNHGCRCDPCRAAWAEYVAAYRAKRFAGKRCATPGCTRAASQATGNGLCVPCTEAE